MCIHIKSNCVFLSLQACRYISFHHFTWLHHICKRSHLFMMCTHGCLKMPTQVAIFRPSLRIMSCLKTIVQIKTPNSCSISHRIRWITTRIHAWHFFVYKGGKDTLRLNKLTCALCFHLGFVTICMRIFLPLFVYVSNKIGGKMLDSKIPFHTQLYFKSNFFCGEIMFQFQRLSFN